MEEKLLERVKVCESLRQERNIALDTLQKKGLTDITREILKGNSNNNNDDDNVATVVYVFMGFKIFTMPHCVLTVLYLILIDGEGCGQ